MKPLGTPSHPMPGRRIMRLLWLLGLVAAGLLACQSAWSPRLIRTDESRWVQQDRRLLLSNSPWVRQTRADIEGLKGGGRAQFHVAASWLSPYIQTARSVLLPRLESQLPVLLVFDPSLETDQGRYRGPLRVAGYPPMGLDRRTLVVSPLFGQGLAFWPTGLAQSAAAHRALGALPPMESLISQELDDLTVLSEFFALDLTLTPLFSRGDDPSTPAPDACLEQIMGHTLLRGARLVRADGRPLPAAQVFILSHDIEGHWTKAARSFKGKDPVILAPVVARLLFPRHEDGAAFLDETQAQVTLELESPPGTAEPCAKTPEGLILRVSIPFSLDLMRQVGPHGV